MTQIVNTSSATKAQYFPNIKNLLVIASGIGLLAGLSQIEIPLSPVPITLQTLAIYFLGLFYTPFHAISSALGYLVAASMGMPVLAGGSADPSWIILPTAGYLLGFPVAAWAIASMLKIMGPRTTLKTFLALFIGEGLIYIPGLAVLALFVEPSQLLTLGLWPFIPGALVKMAIALCTERTFRNFL